MTWVEKKGSISGEDVSLLLQRYSAPTILALLWEVSQFAGHKIDWKTLVKRTTTGVSSAREYQMLWRHLAYRHTLLEKLEDGAEPLDDDSDLDFEVEVVPAVSSDTSSEAVAHVKDLMANGLQHDSCPKNWSTVKAPLTINVPNDQMSCVPSEKQQMARCTRGTNTTVPISVQKQAQNTGPSAEVLDENGLVGSGLPTKKKRKYWSKEEDQELIAAVKKCGEGNWATILKGDFKYDRTASQLAQRWATIRKRQGNPIPAGGNKSRGSTRSEEILAAQKAANYFIDMQRPRNSSSGRIAIQSGTNPASSSAFSAPISEAASTSASPAFASAKQHSDPAASQKGALNPSKKPRPNLKRLVVPVVPPACPNSSIQAAVFAAGGRIAAPSTAANTFKAAQSKSAVGIRPGGGAPPKQPVTGGKLLPTTNTWAAPVVNLGPPVPRHIWPAVMPPSPVMGRPPRLGRHAASASTRCDDMLVEETGGADEMISNALYFNEKADVDGHFDLSKSSEGESDEIKERQSRVVEKSDSEFALTISKLLLEGQAGVTFPCMTELREDNHCLQVRFCPRGGTRTMVTTLSGGEVAGEVEHEPRVHARQETSQTWQPPTGRRSSDAQASQITHKRRKGKTGRKVESSRVDS